MERIQWATKSLSGLLLGLSVVGCAVLAPEPERNDDFEVWLVDQSNSPGQAHGGTIYVYEGAQFSALPTAASTSPMASIDLAGATSAMCMEKTSANPVRPHMLVFNESHTHAVLAFVASGHVVIFNAQTRQPLDCIRTTVLNDNRQAHAAFPSPDGSYILVANQNGKALERIDTDYNTNTFTHRPEATLNLATCTTPSGAPCESPTLRPFNAPICPVIDRNSRFAFVTLRDGGMFVVDATTTPMSIVAEYDRETVKGNGCGGAQVGTSMYINSGGSAVPVSSSGGTSHPMLFGFDVYRFPTSGYSAGNPPNTPAPLNVFSKGGAADSHGVAVTADGRHLWVFDRHSDVVEVIATSSNQHVATIPLAGAASSNPAPDLADISPNGDLFFVALRGPTPLTGDPHNATGNTPGLGIVEIGDDGRSGSLASVVRITNVGSDGIERADAHAVRVRLR